MDRIYVALDLELTGLDSRRDEIIEIAMVKFRGHEVLETFASLVRPQRPIPLKVQHLVGLDSEEVSSAPPLRSLSGRILTMAASHPIVAHSVGMDQQFLNRHGLLLNNLPIDTFELAGILMPGAGRYSLANLAQILGIEMPQNHRALPDALATKDLFLALLDRARGWDADLLQELAQLAAGTDWPLARVFRDLAEETRGADGFLSAGSPTKVQGRKAPPAEERFEPLEPRETIEPVDGAALAALVSPDGPFARAFPGYEHRPQQVEMVRAVAEALNTPSHLLIEAGTGTGKSIAYLLPVMQFAMQNGQRVVISSNTINLQDQLFSKDIPDIRRILGWTFQAALLKGRANYICLRRFEAFRRSRQLNAAELSALAKMMAWLPQTRTGDRAELVLLNNDQSIWGLVQSTPETCLGDLCPHRQRGRCFFQRARTRAERAHLIVVNHALLLSDLAMDSRVLPEYHYAVIDEAHHLEGVATDQFGVAASRRDLYAYLTDVSHVSGGAPGGILARVPAVYQGSGASQSNRDRIAATIEATRDAVDEAEARLYALFNSLEAFAAQAGDRQRSDSGPYEQTIRLTPGQRAQPDWSNVEVAWQELSQPLQRVLKGLSALAEQIEGLGLEEASERAEIQQEVAATLKRGQSLHDGLDGIVGGDNRDTIYWLSLSNQDAEITLHSAPLHVGPLLQERLFAEKDAVILTSATLQTGESFAYIRERLGIEDPTELALDSPFDYKTAVLLFVPKDIPEPNQPYYQKSVERAVIDACTATEGRAMVLFTSNSQLNSTYRAVQRPLEDEGIVVYGQGFDGSRQHILESFRSTPRAVLLGTRSFWEGVDIVGEALSCLIIARLPFAVPTDPVFAARAETFDNAFDQYYLPDAILRFRQGFGRLIRSKEDYGLVVVLDRRILTKSYGKTILRSLPECTARQGPLSVLPSVAQRWLDPDNRR